MSLHQFHSQFESGDPPQTQRMTADESRAVIALWQQERVEPTGLTDRPAVSDVAEGLDIPVEEVQRLLAEVRARRIGEEAALAQEQELSETRLAEEDRRLEEIQRQQAVLGRKVVENERQNAGLVEANKQSLGLKWPFAVLIISILAVIWLISVIHH